MLVLLTVYMKADLLFVLATVKSVVTAIREADYMLDFTGLYSGPALIWRFYKFIKKTQEEKQIQVQ